MKNKIILIVLAIITVVASIFCAIYLPESEINNTIDDIQDIIIDEIKEIGNISTIEIEDLSIEEEIELEEQDVESEAFELQGEIAYEGDRAKSWNVELGDYAGLTYYSQVDARWKNHAYTSINNKSQTIGTSGCGPTSAAMIVSSIKGTITPDKIGDLFVKYGYRSKNSGTYWSAFRAVADEFDIGYTETNNLDKAVELLRNNNYVIASVGNGLFTYGGHFIVLVSVDNNTIKIYDPYLYSGKFDTSTRRNKVQVSGNTVYCSVENFRKYANFKGFFAYKYDVNNVIKENSTDEKVTTNSNIVDTKGTIKTLNSNTKLYTNTNMSTGYNYKKGTKVQVLENITSKIDKVLIVKTGLVRYMYNSDTNTSIPTNVETTKSNVVLNKTYSLISNTKLYTNSNITVGYNYKKGTKVQVLQNISSSVVKVKVVKTNVIRYVNTKYLK